MNKRVVCIVLSAVMSLMLNTGCSKSNEISDIESGEIAGGWTYSGEFAEFEMPSEAKEAFDKAVGTDYKALAYLGSQVLDSYLGSQVLVSYLGSQVMAWVNYGYLCADENSALTTVKVWVNLDGESSVIDTAPVDFGLYQEDSEIKFEELSGGFTFVNAVGSGLTDDFQKQAFEKAVEKIDGVKYEALACVGTQVVAGLNFVTLCKATKVDSEQTALAVLTVYASLDGDGEVLSTCGFEM